MNRISEIWAIRHTYLDEFQVHLLFLGKLVDVVILLSQYSEILRDFFLFFVAGFLYFKIQLMKKIQIPLTQLGIKLFGSSSVHYSIYILPSSSPYFFIMIFLDILPGLALSY